MSLFRTILMTFSKKDTQWEIVVPEGGGEYGAFFVGNVDWGDGSPIEIGNNISTKLTHIYEPGTYIITLSGKNHRVAHERYGNILATNAKFVRRILWFGDDINPVFEYGFKRCSNLVRIECGFPDHFTDMSYSFKQCGNLSWIKDPSLPLGITNGGNAISIFEADHSLLIDVEKLFSKFNESSSAKLSYSCNFCEKIYGTAPGNKLWYNPNIISHRACFANCTGISNYNVIPDDWKY